MNLKNFLDLRKKSTPQIKIVERIVIRKRSLQKDLFLTLAVMFVASGVIWGISKADTLIESVTRPQTKNFSAVGVVLNIDATNLYIDQAKGTDDLGRITYTLDLSTVTKIETNKYSPLSISDIKAGDKVVVQGQEDGGNITIKRIISFGVVVPKEEVATSAEKIATTTEAVVTTATSTIESSVIPVQTGIQSENADLDPRIREDDRMGEGNNAGVGASTSTQQTVSVDSSSTESVPTTTGQATTSKIIETITNAVGNIVDTVKDVVQTVIDTVVGTSTNEILVPAETTTLPTPDPIPTSENTSTDVKME